MKGIRLSAGSSIVNLRLGCRPFNAELETHVYRKPTNTGLLLHFQSHVDKHYKTGLLKTLLHRTHALSSTTEAFHEECTKLRSIFSRLDYPIGLINSTIDMFIQNIATKPGKKTDDGNTIRIVLRKVKCLVFLLLRRQNNSKGSWMPDFPGNKTFLLNPDTLTSF